MKILYVLIPLGVVLMGVAVRFFFWSVKSGQYDDLEGPAHRILMDDDDPLIPPPYDGEKPEKGSRTVTKKGRG